MRYAYEPQLQDIYDIRNRHETQLYPYPQPLVDTPYNFESVRQPRPEDPHLTFEGYGIAAALGLTDAQLNQLADLAMGTTAGWVPGSGWAAVPPQVKAAVLENVQLYGFDYLVQAEANRAADLQKQLALARSFTQPQPVAPPQSGGLGLGLPKVPTWLWLAAGAGVVAWILMKQPTTAPRRA